MESKYKHFILLFIALLAVGLVQYRHVTTPNKVVTVYDTTLKVIRDTVNPPQKVIHVPYKVLKDTFWVDTIRIPADTAAILADYFAKRVYSDTLLNDSTALIAVLDTIQFNRRVGQRELKYLNRLPRTITYQSAPSKWEIGAGIGYGDGVQAGLYAKKGNIMLSTSGKSITLYYKIWQHGN